MPFVHTWMAFNGWMACVTEEETDAGMVRACASDERLIRANDQIMAGSPTFRESVLSFSSHWPVLNVRDAKKKLGRTAIWDLSADEYKQRCSEKGVKQQPAVSSAGSTPSWEELLRVIYQVRCNLFHGTKAPGSYRDRQLVLGSGEILKQFLKETACLEWG
jgi:hypothetical protein